MCFSRPLGVYWRRQGHKYEQVRGDKQSTGKQSMDIRYESPNSTVNDVYIQRPRNHEHLHTQNIPYFRDD